MHFNQNSLTEASKILPEKTKHIDLSVPDIVHKESVPIHTQDYVNAFVVNDVGNVLILENTQNGRSWGSWQMIGRSLIGDEDPMLAVQQDLQQRTGYACTEWIYLGTYIIDESQKQGAGYFFCARPAKQIALPDAEHAHNITLKWVSKREMKQGLMDGRIAGINHAVAVSLALVMCSCG
jgi:hypothetical protein